MSRLSASLGEKKNNNEFESLKKDLLDDQAFLLLLDYGCQEDNLVSKAEFFEAQVQKIIDKNNTKEISWLSLRCISMFDLLMMGQLIHCYRYISLLSCHIIYRSTSNFDSDAYTLINNDSTLFKRDLLEFMRHREYETDSLSHPIAKVLQLELSYYLNLSLILTNNIFQKFTCLRIDMARVLSSIADPYLFGEGLNCLNHIYKLACRKPAYLMEHITEFVNKHSNFTIVGEYFRKWTLGIIDTSLIKDLVLLVLNRNLKIMAFGQLVQEIDISNLSFFNNLIYGNLQFSFSHYLLLKFICKSILDCEPNFQDLGIVTFDLDAHTVEISCSFKESMGKIHSLHAKSTTLKIIWGKVAEHTENWMSTLYESK
ncbi:MAG: hypothetical protein MHPSP_002268 [Paramarteilia canceri]